MPIDKGSESGESRRPNDWERIETERAQRDRIQKAYDATHDPSEVWEKAARPLPPDYGLDRPRHREIPPEVAAMFGKTPEQIHELRAKMFDELEARRDRLTAAADAGAEKVSDQADEVPRSDADRPATFDAERADRIPEYQTPGGKTRGLLDVAGQQVDVVSGYDGPVKEIGGPQALGIPDGYAIASHAESHAAAEIRRRGASEAEVYVNRRPCPGPAGCDEWLPDMLPEDNRTSLYYMVATDDPPQRDDESGPYPDSQGREWRGRIYEGTLDEEDNDG